MNIALLKSVMQDILGQIDHKFIDKEVEYFKVSFSKRIFMRLNHWIIWWTLGRCIYSRKFGTLVFQWAERRIGNSSTRRRSMGGWRNHFVWNWQKYCIHKKRVTVCSSSSGLMVHGPLADRPRPGSSLEAILRTANSKPRIQKLLWQYFFNCEKNKRFDQDLLKNCISKIVARNEAGH